MKMAVDTAVTVPVNVCPLIDDTDFKTRETAVAYNASGLDLVWNFVTPAGVQTQTAVTPTNTGGSYDWVNVGDGMYNIEIPASGGASINNDTEGYGWFSGLATGVLPWVGPIIEFVPDHVVNGLVTGSDKLQVDTIEVNSVSLATDGPVPHLGIVDQGTAQSATSTGIVLRSAAAFADDTLIGCTIGAYGSTQGYWQFRQITDNALSGDTVTVDAWTVTPSGTITYKIFGGAPASATLPPAVNVTQWKGATAPDNTGDAYAVVNSGTFGNSALKTLIDAIDDYIDTEVAAIKAKTDQLTFTVSNVIDANVTHCEGNSTIDGKSIDVLLQRIHSYLWSKRSGLSGTDPDTVTIRNFADSADVGTITFDQYGNNTSST